MDRSAKLALGLAALGGIALYLYSTSSQAAPGAPSNGSGSGASFDFSNLFPSQPTSSGSGTGGAGFDFSSLFSSFVTTPAQDTSSAITTSTGGSSMTGASWQTGDYPEYASLISNVEQQDGIPTNLLARLLYQESHYRADIISGAMPSPAGALGIAQFMPATAAQFGIDPTDPYQAIPAAGKYLAQLYGALGDWQLAIMAYNWGIGNVRKWVAGGESGPVPSETQNYVAQITADVPVA